MCFFLPPLTGGRSGWRVYGFSSPLRPLPLSLSRKGGGDLYIKLSSNFMESI